MSNFYKIFKFSFKETLKTRSIYIYLLIILTLNGLICFLSPPLINDAIVTKGTAFRWASLNQVPLYIQFGSTIMPLTFALYATMNAENIINIDERIFILSRPIKRITYVMAKITCSFFVNICMLLLIFFEYLLSSIIFKYNPFLIHYKGQQTSDLLHVYPNATSATTMVIILFFLITITASISGSIFRFFFKNKITSVIVMLFVLLTNLLTQIIWSFKASDPLNTYNTIHVLWLFVIIPLFVYVPIIVASLWIGLKLTFAENIRI